MKANVKQIMKAAWEMARAAVVNFGGKAREYVSAALKMAWANAKITAKTVEVEFLNGTHTAYMTITGSKVWQNDSKSMVRKYFNLEWYGKRAPFTKIFEVLVGANGTARGGFVMEMDGRTFVFECDHFETRSRTKMDCAKDAARSIIRKIIAVGM